MQEYHSIITHPENGEMLNLTKSAKYLGVSRKKFRRIAPPPDYVQDGIWPFWSKRVLDILPVIEDFNHDEVYKRGKACGSYLIGDMDDQEISKLRYALINARNDFIVSDYTPSPPEEKTRLVLEEYGIKTTFRSWREAQEFRNGILSTIKDYAMRNNSGG